MSKSLRPAFPAWPAIAAAIAYGTLEWLALSRSRVLARLGMRRRQISRR
jgi:hypothetical protein